MGWTTICRCLVRACIWTLGVLFWASPARVVGLFLERVVLLLLFCAPRRVSSLAGLVISGRYLGTRLVVVSMANLSWRPRILARLVQWTNAQSQIACCSCRVSDTTDSTRSPWCRKKSASMMDLETLATIKRYLYGRRRPTFKHRRSSPKVSIIQPFAAYSLNSVHWLLAALAYESAGNDGYVGAGIYEKLHTWRFVRDEKAALEVVVVADRLYWRRLLSFSDALLKVHGLVHFFAAEPNFLW